MPARRNSYEPFAPSKPKHVAVRRKGRADRDAEERVTVVLPPLMPHEEMSAAIERIGNQLPHEREYFGSQEYAEKCGADPDHLSEVERFARKQGLDVVEISAAKRCVVLRGTVGAFEAAFRVVMYEYSGPTAQYQSHSGPLSLPARLHGIIEAVLGLDARPVTVPLLSASPAMARRSTTPSEVAEFYNFPEGDGAGQSIGIVLPGGGFRKPDMEAYFSGQRLPMPNIKVVNVLGVRNTPAHADQIDLVRRIFHAGAKLGENNLSDFAAGLFTTEANLDVQLCGAFAGGARIVVYFSPDSTEGHFHAISEALTDRHRPGVISCSWSAHESEMPVQAFRVLDTVFQTAVLRGVTICFSSGDDGDGSLWGKKLGVHFPSSSPHVLACGGTEFVATRGERTWDESTPRFRMASGGGFSRFRRPSWQKGIRAGDRKGRGVPDVAGKADVQGGYEIVVLGERFNMGGTSASAPMWASLITRINQRLGKRVGFINPLLYSSRFGSATRDIMKGNNGKFSAGPGWDACTGLGSPNGKELLKALSAP